MSFNLFVYISADDLLHLRVLLSLCLLFIPFPFSPYLLVPQQEGGHCVKTSIRECTSCGQPSSAEEVPIKLLLFLVFIFLLSDSCLLKELIFFSPNLRMMTELLRYKQMHTQAKIKSFQFYGPSFHCIIKLL